MPQYMLLIYSPGPHPRAGWRPRARSGSQYTQALRTPASCAPATRSRARTPRRPCACATARPLISDGPFAETKEALGGYYLIDVDDLDAALGWAAKIPNVGYGSIEVRPVMLIPSMPPA